MTGIASKMAAAGYWTASYGKWDVGMATPDHTPEGRGYQAGINYFHHDNDYWSMASDTPSATSWFFVFFLLTRGHWWGRRTSLVYPSSVLPRGW